MKIGDRVRDIASGLEGIVTGTAEWITGCTSVSIQPPAKDGSIPDAIWIDSNRIAVLEAAAVKVNNHDRTIGGPRNAPGNPSMPRASM